MAPFVGTFTVDAAAFVQVGASQEHQGVLVRATNAAQRATVSGHRWRRETRQLAQGQLLVPLQEADPRAPLLDDLEDFDARSDLLVVVDDADETRPIGTMSRRDLIAAYDFRVQQNLEDGGSTNPGWEIPMLERLPFRGPRKGGP